MTRPSGAPCRSPSGSWEVDPNEPVPARRQEGNQPHAPSDRRSPSRSFRSLANLSLSFADDGLQGAQDAAPVFEVIAPAVEQCGRFSPWEELPRLAGRHAAVDRGTRPAGPLVEPPCGHHLGDARAKATFDVDLLRLTTMTIGGRNGGPGGPSARMKSHSPVRPRSGSTSSLCPEKMANRSPQGSRPARRIGTTMNSLRAFSLTRASRVPRASQSGS